MTCWCTSARDFVLTIGPMSVSASRGSPTVTWDISSTNLGTNLSYMASVTMNRLAPMQLCPQFRVRPALQAAAATSTSASSRMMYESAPPSSRTARFSSRPAWAPSSFPTGVLPVRATPRTWGCSRTRLHCRPAMGRLVKTPGGNPASSITDWMAFAQVMTLEACFRSMVFPAERPQAACRNTCQNGKFQGMTIKITPRGWKVTKLFWLDVATCSGARNCGRCCA
mmetsp:Transcript_86902/g.151244  ORF Transcript_86902/g.151244 Transcript_86902/m.151244 type:complete len:225 (-) Transcript_86902:304-978(-)